MYSVHVQSIFLIGFNRTKTILVFLHNHAISQDDPLSNHPLALMKLEIVWIRETGDILVITLFVWVFFYTFIN